MSLTRSVSLLVAVGAAPALAFHAPISFAPRAFAPRLAVARPAGRPFSLAARRGGAATIRLAAAAASPDSTPAPTAAETAEALMDTKMSGLGVSWYQVCMVLFVALVYAADGTEVAVMSLVSRELGQKFSLVGWEKGLLGSAVYSGMFTGGLIAGPIADTKGRSFSLVAATLLISIFGVASAYAPTFALLCLARYIAGVGMGASLPVSSSLLQETVPYAWKGGLACLVFSGFNLGEFFAARMGVYAFARRDPSCWLFLVAAIPAVITFAVSLLVPESPRFLASRGQKDELVKWFKVWLSAPGCYLGVPTARVTAY